MSQEPSNMASKLTDLKSEMENNDEDDDVEIKAGAIIESKKPASYTVIELLGEGGFGAVYRVHETGDKKKIYAMKVEKSNEQRQHSKLKMEVMLLKKRPGVDRGSRCHFTSLQDRGKKQKFTFVVMQLVGKNLADLKNARPEKVFSIVTGLASAIQTLESCEDLNKIGYIHRDLKPANFAIGLENPKLIYMLDFGIARCILNNKGELKAPRASTKFKGTVKFASLSCHKRLELGSVDDLESWFYMTMDVMNPGGLPWKGTKDKDAVHKKKEAARTNSDALIGPLKCKTELAKIWKYITSLGYHDKTADYSYMYQIIVKGITAAGGSLNDPYDWEK